MQFFVKVRNFDIFKIIVNRAHQETRTCDPALEKQLTDRRLVDEYVEGSSDEDVPLQFYNIGTQRDRQQEHSGMDEGNQGNLYDQQDVDADPTVGISRSVLMALQKDIEDYRMLRKELALQAEIHKKYQKMRKKLSDSKQNCENSVFT